MATSKLQIIVGDRLDKAFPQFRIRENYRPEWMRSSELSKLELDFYIEDIKIAFEVQGAQHYQFVEFFHKTNDEFERRKRLDNEKIELCEGHGVKLIEIFTETDIVVAIKEIEEKYCQQPKYYYQEKTISKNKRQKQKDLFRMVNVLKSQGIVFGKEKRHNELNNEKEVQKRLEVCRQNISKYEQGLISATDEKVLYWRNVIANNGLFSETL